jgi:hypothetical protein
MEGEPHSKACCELIAHKSYGRYLKMDEQGHPHIDKAKVKTEERLDGKYLIRTSDDTLSPVDVALGYKQLYQVENAFRTLKTTLELHPVYHRLEDLDEIASDTVTNSGDRTQNSIRQHDQNVYLKPGFEAIV